VKLTEFLESGRHFRNRTGISGITGMCC